MKCVPGRYQVFNATRAGLLLNTKSSVRLKWAFSPHLPFPNVVRPGDGHLRFFFRQIQILPVEH